MYRSSSTRGRRFLLAVSLGLTVALTAVGAQSLPEEAAAPVPEPGLSARNANYTIDVELDPLAKTLTARQVVQWRNLQQQPTQELWFHLYWNAWRNNHSTWMRENRLSGRMDRQRSRVAKGDWGYTEIDAARLPDGRDLTAKLRFAAPDDRNADDRTVVVLTLPEPVAPGETVTVELDWRAKIPRTFARTGFRGNYFFIAHWFPALGVYEAKGWNCHQFHAPTEFFSDFGVYDVRLTVPTGWVLGATGRPAEVRDNDNGTTTHRYVQADVHTFTWTTSPDYRVREARFEKAGLPPVDLRLLYQPEHESQVERHLDATRAALEHYGTWYGPYPYGHVTIVDPAFGSGAGGMEYPTLFTSGTRLWNPEGGGSPEGVTIHEAGHQFWYGIVANNEIEHAWLDEGLNTFSTSRAYDAAYGDEFHVERYLDPPGLRGVRGGFLPVLFKDVRYNRVIDGGRLGRYIASRAETADAMSEHTYRYFIPTAARLSYDKTAMWLMTLERHLGWDTLQNILSTFFERYQFRHPRPQDFFAVANEVSGKNLRWFFDQVYRQSLTFDYAVDSVVSLPAGFEGFAEAKDGGELVYTGPSKKEGGKRFRSEVMLRRHGGGVFPVDVLMVFEDGSEVRESWNGRQRSKLFVLERPAKLAYAVVDPDRVLLLDLDYTNNSRLREPAAKLPAAKWASKWMIWLQDLLHTFTFFV